jgi:mRNA interferase HigB
MCLHTSEAKSIPMQLRICTSEPKTPCAKTPNYPSEPKSAFLSVVRLPSCGVRILRISCRRRCELHIISRKKLLEAGKKHGGIAAPLDSWFRTAKSAEWRNLEEVRQTYSHADGVPVGERVYTVFNISGNSFRLIAADSRDLLRRPGDSHKACADACRIR